MICNRIACVTELAHQVDCAMGNHTFMDTLEESVFDMEEIDVEVSAPFPVIIQIFTPMNYNLKDYFYTNYYNQSCKVIILNGFRC